MAIYKKQGRFYVDNLDYKFISTLVKRFKTIQEFLAYVGVNNIVLRNIKNNGAVRLSTVEKILGAFDDVTPKDLIRDYKEADYVYFDIDLKQYKPTEKDLADCEALMKLYSSTIKEFTRSVGVERHNKVMGLLKRLMLESQYYGVLLEKLNRSAKVISVVEQVRNKEN